MKPGEWTLREYLQTVFSVVRNHRFLMSGNPRHGLTENPYGGTDVRHERSYRHAFPSPIA